MITDSYMPLPTQEDQPEYTYSIDAEPFKKKVTFPAPYTKPSKHHLHDMAPQQPGHISSYTLNHNVIVTIWHRVHLYGLHHYNCKKNMTQMKSLEETGR